MTEQLKTLKDIYHPDIYKEGDESDRFEYVDQRELRAEAIKHIKADESKDIELPFNRVIAMCNSKHRCDACIRFQYFFNIDEKELK